MNVPRIMQEIAKMEDLEVAGYEQSSQQKAIPKHRNMRIAVYAVAASVLVVISWLIIEKTGINKRIHEEVTLDTQNDSSVKTAGEQIKPITGLSEDQVYNETNEKISEISQRILNHQNTTKDERELMSRYPTVQLIDEQNRVIVFFSKESNIHNLPEEEFLKESQQLFEDIVGKYEVDEFKLVSEEELRHVKFIQPESK